MTDRDGGDERGEVERAVTRALDQVERRQQKWLVTLGANPAFRAELRRIISEVRAEQAVRETTRERYATCDALAAAVTAVLDAYDADTTDWQVHSRHRQLVADLRDQVRPAPPTDPGPPS